MESAVRKLPGSCLSSLPLQDYGGCLYPDDPILSESDDKYFLSELTTDKYEIVSESQAHHCFCLTGRIDAELIYTAYPAFPASYRIPVQTTPLASAPLRVELPKLLDSTVLLNTTVLVRWVATAAAEARDRDSPNLWRVFH